MSSSAVTYEAVDQIAIVTLNRPAQRNAINQDVADGLLAAWERFNASDERVAILTNAGDDFCVGVDVKAPAQDFPACVPNVGVRLNKPLIAAVSGWTVGGAVVMVQMADLCVAADTTKFSFPEAKVGFTGALVAGLAARIPHKIAMELMLLGEVVGAERAYQVGLVNKVVPRDQLLEAAMSYARRLAANAPMVLALLREFVSEVLPRGPSEVAAHGRLAIARVRQSEDAKEGVASFKAKRKPQFKGK
ncbi:MAG: crotonase [Betaproteobacteria bacterium]|nr:crotonase [Betaproteobacteria bacterium]